MQNKSIRTYNHDFKRHGYWEVYHRITNNLWFKRFYSNDTVYGFEEIYSFKVNLIHKAYYAR
jgi:hypothetical protein